MGSTYSNVGHVMGTNSLQRCLPSADSFAVCARDSRDPQHLQPVSQERGGQSAYVSTLGASANTRGSRSGEWVARRSDSHRLAYLDAQNFVQFDCSSAKDELEKRFSHFTNQLLPAVLRSAVQSANTVIFVPSSLDFIRIQNHFRKQQLSFAVLSE